MNALCARCAKRASRDKYHLWHPELCRACVEEIKDPSMRRGVAAAAKAAAVGVCVNCRERPASADEWSPTWCVVCIAAGRENCGAP